MDWIQRVDCLWDHGGHTGRAAGEMLGCFDTCWSCVAVLRASGQSYVTSAKAWELGLQPLAFLWVGEKHGCTLLKAYLYMLCKTTLFTEFCPYISLVKSQLPCPVCQFSKDVVFFQRRKSVGAGVWDCVIPLSWQTEHEKPGLFPVYLLQFLESTLNCCNVVCVLCQTKLFIFTVWATGQDKVRKTLLLVASY